MVSRAVGPVAALAACALAASVACSDLKRADETADDAGSGDSGLGDREGGGADGALADGATADAGAPPTDFECAEPWTTATKTKAECGPRQVKDVDSLAPIDPQGISIARTPAGRVGIAYNDEQDGETGELHLAHFTPTTAIYPAPTIVKRRTAAMAFHDGYQAKLAASAPDTLAVLSYDMDDVSQSGEVHLRKLVAGKEPLTDDLMVTGVKNPTEIAVASDLAGHTYATVRISTGATSAKLASYEKNPTGAFTGLPDLATGLVVPNEAPGVGAASLFVDPGGQAHLLFHYHDATGGAFSTPRYHSLAATTWSYRKTVDNNVPDGLSGFSPRVVVFGTKKFAVFYFRKGGQSNPATADLRLATWESELDTPMIEILDQQIPSDDPIDPTYRVAMAIDKFGLIHIANIRPSMSPTTGYLEYRRQTRLAGGATKWLSDIVDPDVLSTLSTAFVDIVVDEQARPHIAYRSAKDGKVKYATRFDR